MRIVFSAQDWPVVTAMLPFAQRDPGARPNEQTARQWAEAFREVAEAGFSGADLTDVWVRPGDLSPARLGELRAAAQDEGVELPAISAIRCSVIDASDGLDNLAYSHRTLEAADRLDIGTVSFGLHQALTSQQREQLWFWTVEGHQDPPDDPETWRLAVERLTELGKHAATLGIVMSLEMYEDTYLGEADLAVRLVQDIGLDNVGLNPDLGNLIRPHRRIESWRELVEKTVPYTNYWHVKNYSRDENLASGLFTTTPTTLELGLIDYRWAVRCAVAAGFQGIICAEHYGGDGLSISATNQQYLRDKILPKTADYAAEKSLTRQYQDR